jgi:hypothetical protein
MIRACGGNSVRPFRLARRDVERAGGNRCGKLLGGLPMQVGQLAEVAAEALAPENDGEAKGTTEVVAASAAPDTETEKDTDGHALPPEVQAKVNGRIGKLTARAKTAEEKATALTEELATIKRHKPTSIIRSGRISRLLTLDRDEFGLLRTEV